MQPTRDGTVMITMARRALTAAMPQMSTSWTRTTWTTWKRDSIRGVDFCLLSLEEERELKANSCYKMMEMSRRTAMKVVGLRKVEFMEKTCSKMLEMSMTTARRVV